MVRAVIDGCIRFDRTLPEAIECRLVRSFSFPNAEYFRMLRMGRPVEHYNIEDTIQVARETEQGLVLPRGVPEKIKNLFELNRSSVEWVDRRTVGKDIQVPQSRDAFTPRPFQTEAVRLILKHLQGLVIVGCGGGKTTIATMAIRAIGKTTVVFVHTEDLLDQWLEVVEARLGIKPGRISEGNCVPGPIVVAMVQSVWRHLEDEDVLAVLRGAGAVFMDEVHHAPANMFRTVLEACPARYRIGLTATPNREDGLGKIMDWSFGHRLIEVPSSELIKLGYLMQPKLEVIETDFEFSSAEEDKLRRSILIHAALEQYEKRKHLIASFAANQIKDGQSVLVLANRKSYARELGRLIWEYGGKAIVVTGETPKNARKESIQGFRRGEVRCLVATSLANEGLDTVHLSRLILAWPESTKGGTDQKTGRLIRIANKIPIVHDFVDSKVPELVNRYKSRCVTYRKLGMKPPRISE